MNVKDELLQILSDNRGKFFSGPELSEKLGCSRMAINKAVSSIRLDGFDIETNKRSGYKMSIFSDVLTGKKIESYLGGGIKAYVYDELDSTQNKVKQMLSQGEASPFIVAAKKQSKGRGRLTRSFFSPEGGVYFSVSIPGSLINNLDLLTISASVAVRRAILRLTGKEAKLKWVNDVYLDGKKCTGIISEGIFNFEEKRLESVVIGIGINLAVRNEDFPEDVREVATSLFPDGKTSLERATVIAEVTKELLRLQSEDFLDEYRKNCFVLDKDVVLIQGDKREYAHSVGIADDGALIVKDENGNVRNINAGEISLRIKK